MDCSHQAAAPRQAPPQREAGSRAPVSEEATLNPAQGAELACFLLTHVLTVGVLESAAVQQHDNDVAGGWRGIQRGKRIKEDGDASPGGEG